MNTEQNFNSSTSHVIVANAVLPAVLLTAEYEKVINYPNHFKATEDCRFVYLYRNEFSGLCKIGITNNPKTRLCQLINSSGMYLQDLLVLECQVDYDEHPLTVEKFLHMYFREKRKYGEWFELSIRDILAIRNLFWKIEGESISDNIKKYLSKNGL